MSNLAHTTLTRTGWQPPAAATVGRALVALLFIVLGIDKAFNFDAIVGWIAYEGLPFASLIVTTTIAFEVIVGIALLAGIGQRLGALLLAAFVVVATVVLHDFWAAPAEQFADQLTHFMKNIAIVGGLLLLARSARE